MSSHDFDDGEEEQEDGDGRDESQDIENAYGELAGLDAVDHEMELGVEYEEVN